MHLYHVHTVLNMHMRVHTHLCIHMYLITSIFKQFLMVHIYKCTCIMFCLPGGQSSKHFSCLHVYCITQGDQSAWLHDKEDDIHVLYSRSHSHHKGTTMCVYCMYTRSREFPCMYPGIHTGNFPICIPGYIVHTFTT